MLLLEWRHTPPILVFSMKKYCLVLFVFALYTLITIGNSNAQTTTSSLANETKQMYDDKWALVIGVNQFPHQLRTLNYCEKDAEDFYNYLISNAGFQPDHVQLLQGTDANHENIKKAVDWLRRASESNDLSVVYFRTHGIYASYARTAYFAANDTNVSKLTETGFEMSKFVSLVLNSVKARNIAMILDSDFSGHAIGYGSGHHFSTKKQQAVFLFTSADMEGYSKESPEFQNSLYTKAFLENLKESKKNESTHPVNSSQVNGKTKKKTRTKQFIQASGVMTKSTSSGWSKSWGKDANKNIVLNTPATDPREAPKLDLTILSR